MWINIGFFRVSVTISKLPSIKPATEEVMSNLLSIWVMELFMMAPLSALEIKVNERAAKNILNPLQHLFFPFFDGCDSAVLFKS